MAAAPVGLPAWTAGVWADTVWEDGVWAAEGDTPATSLRALRRVRVGSTAAITRG